MELLSPNSLPPTRLLQTLEQSRVRVFSTYKSGAPTPTLRRFWSPRLSPRAPPWMAAALSSQENSAPVATPKSLCRIGDVKRVTKETDVHVNINLDGSGVANCSTGIPFLDHMLDQLASHGLFDLHVKATGDIHIDDHHTNEDVALAIGTVRTMKIPHLSLSIISYKAYLFFLHFVIFLLLKSLHTDSLLWQALLQALGDRKGIFRFGHFAAPLDEAAIEVILDLSGRPHLSYDLIIPTERVGTYDTQLVEHFFQSLVNTSGMTLHIRQLAGRNSHHIIEATFKAFARALRQAIEYDFRRGGSVPSSKGVLSRS